MQIELSNIDFAVAVSTFKDEVADKLEFLTKMELQFLRTFEHRVNISDYHSEMIYEIRKMVASIQEMYKDVKDYFVEMKVEFIYDFVRRLQTIMVIGYNHLSQALLITFDMYQTEKNKSKELSGTGNMKCTCQVKNDFIWSKNEIRRIQQIDYTIKSLQTEQQRLLDEMGVIYDRMMMQKGLIEKVKPSLATKQLQEMKDRIETVMENNEKLFQETYMMKFFEFHNHIKKLDKPEKITQVYHKMNETFKKNFIQHAIKAANKIQHARRCNPDNMHSVEVQTEDVKSKIIKKDSPRGQPISVFNQNGNSQYALVKERKLNEKMSVELNLLQKQNLALTDELNSFKSAEKEIQIKYRELVQRFSVIEDMYKKAKTELDDYRCGENFNMQQLIIENKNFKQKISQLRRRFGQGPDLTNTYCQTDRVFKGNIKCNSKELVQNNEFVAEEKQTQTYEEYLLPINDDDVIKLLKSRNQKAIVMLNEKDRKIRDSVTKISIVEDQNNKIKSTLNIFVGIIEEKFIGSKQTSNQHEQSQRSSKINKRTILQMNSQQIQSKIKQVLELIVPEVSDSNVFENPNHYLEMQRKFKKVTSIKGKPDENLQCEMEQNELIERQLSQKRKNIYPKTLSNLAYDVSEQNKKKRLNYLTILASRNNFNNFKVDTECQTEFNQAISGQNFTKRESCTQTLIDDREKSTTKNMARGIRSSIDPKRQKIANQKPLFINRKSKNHTVFNLTSETALSTRKRKPEERIHLNSFEQIKIETSRKKSERQTMVNTLGKVGFSEFLSTQRNLESTKLTQRANLTNSISLLNSEGFQVSDLPNFALQKTLKTTKHLKQSHARFKSQLTSPFRPINETPENEKENEFGNVEFCPHNMMENYRFQKIQPETKFLQTQSSQFSKFRGNESATSKRSQKNKNNLLFSIQSYKTQNANLNDVMLAKCISKMVEKWGKDKIKQTIGSLFSESNS